MGGTEMHTKLRMMSLAVLAIVAVAGLVLWLSAESSEVSSSENAADKSAAGTEPEVVLYYFHGTRRCNTCRTIEAYTQQALEKNFDDQLQAGTLEWKVINTEEPDNEHFVTDFELVSSSLVLVERKGEDVLRHEILQEAWTLVRDEPRFIEYVQKSVQGYLE